MWRQCVKQCPTRAVTHWWTMGKQNVIKKCNKLNTFCYCDGSSASDPRTLCTDNVSLLLDPPEEGKLRHATDAHMHDVNLVHKPIRGFPPTTAIIHQFDHQNFSNVCSLDIVDVGLASFEIIVEPFTKLNGARFTFGAWKDRSWVFIWAV